MPNGGRLVIATANVEAGTENGRQYPQLDPPGRYALLSVSDTGVGMSEEVLSRVFEPFFSTKEVGQGTGLGLATVYGIIKASGGHIDVSSKVGAGTTFRIFLPMVAERPPSSTGRETGLVGKGQETILVVDDDDSVRQMTKMVLQSLGYTILEAANGFDALEVARAHTGAIHLAITDLMMPKLSGPEMAARLSTVRPTLRVLFMSGYTEDTIAQYGVGQAADFIHKPFNLVALTQKVREMLDRR
jgi:CheY-like chemotaxis protein